MFATDKFPRKVSAVFEPRDTLVKALATVFLNPADKESTGKKIFIQKYLGCGCPDEIVEQAKVCFFCRPLGAFLESQTDQSGPSRTATPMEKNVNAHLGLPKNLIWPRTSGGKIVAPSEWRHTAIQKVVKSSKQAVILARLKAMATVDLDAVIEVPGRAFFFLATEGRTGFGKNRLLVQYDSGQLLYQLMGYNRCRLFTITRTQGPKRIEQIDTALTWDGLIKVFDEASDRYPFAATVLDLFESPKSGGSAWKKATNSPFGMY